MKRFIIVAAIFLSGLISVMGRAQVITTTPAFPADTDSVTLIFDAAQGDAGLKNVAPPIYAHTGVITNLSTSGSDWGARAPPFFFLPPQQEVSPDSRGYCEKQSDVLI